MSAGCKRSRTGSGRGSPDRGGRAARRVARRARDARPRRGTARRASVSGSVPCSRPEDEHGVVAPRAGAQEVEDGDAAGRSRRVAPHGRPVEGGEHVPLAHLAARGDEGLQLMQCPGDRVVRLEIDERARVDRRRERPMGVSQQLVGQHPDDLHSRVVGDGDVIGRNAPTAPQLDRDLDVLSPRTIPRPRSLPSTQSTSRRDSPEYGDRRCA